MAGNFLRESDYHFDISTKFERELDELRLRQITEEIENNPTISVIELPNLGITDEQITKIINSILKSKSQRISTINFARNQITSIGLSSILALLKRNDHITSVNMSHNYLARESSQGVVNVLQLNFKITHLNLENTGICRDSLLAIQKLVERNIEIQREISETNYLKLATILKDVFETPEGINDIILGYCRPFSLEMWTYIREKQVTSAKDVTADFSKKNALSFSPNKTPEQGNRMLLFSSQGLIVQQIQSLKIQDPLKDTVTSLKTKKKFKPCFSCVVL